MADTLTVDDDEWDADDCRAMKRTADQMTIWKRDGDKRIAELEAEVRSLLATMLTISENGNDLAQTVVEAYARNGRDLFAERRVTSQPST